MPKISFNWPLSRCETIQNFMHEIITVHKKYAVDPYDVSTIIISQAKNVNEWSKLYIDDFFLVSSRISVGKYLVLKMSSACSYKLQIVWPNVILMSLYHYFAVLGLYYILSLNLRWQTFLFRRHRTQNPQLVTSFFSFTTRTGRSSRNHYGCPQVMEPQILQGQTPPQNHLMSLSNYSFPK